MEHQLATTNVLLGIMATVSAIEGILLLGVGTAGIVIYYRVLAAIAALNGIEQRQIEPLAAHVHAILDDVQHVTSTVKTETARVDHAITSTIERVEDTRQRIRDTIRQETTGLRAFIRGVRTAFKRPVESRPRAGDTY